MAERQSWVPRGQKLLGSCSPQHGGRLFVGRCCAGDIYWEAFGVPGKTFPRRFHTMELAGKLSVGVVHWEVTSSLLRVEGCPLEVPLKLAPGEYC